MYKFGKQSQKHRKTLHPDLQIVLDEAIKIYDFSITCGHRGKDAQNKAFKDNKSTKQWPNSRHNSIPSEAVDICPYPVDWKDVEEFFFLAGIIMAVAHLHGIKLIWGGRWTDPKDCPHFQLVEK